MKKGETPLETRDISRIVDRLICYLLHIHVFGPASAPSSSQFIHFLDRPTGRDPQNLSAPLDGLCAYIPGSYDQSTSALHDDLLADWSVHGLQPGAFPRFLQRPNPQEAFARLSSSRIPRHPLDRSKAVAIQDAVEALSEYVWCISAAQAHHDAGVAELLEKLPDVWKWVKFFLRTPGNLYHTRDKRCDVRYENKVYLDSDGNVHIGMATCNTLLGEVFEQASLHAQLPTGRCVQLPSWRAEAAAIDGGLLLFARISIQQAPRK